MDALRGTQRTWMEKLLKAFNAGNSPTVLPIIFYILEYIPMQYPLKVMCVSPLGDLGRFEELRPYWEQQVLENPHFALI